MFLQLRESTFLHYPGPSTPAWVLRCMALDKACIRVPVAAALVTQEVGVPLLLCRSVISPAGLELKQRDMLARETLDELRPRKAVLVAPRVDLNSLWPSLTMLGPLEPKVKDPCPRHTLRSLVLPL